MTKSEIWQLIGALVSGGALTIIYKFYGIPIKEYANLKARIAHDLHFYADSMEIPKGSEFYIEKRNQRMKAFKEHAAKMTECINKLPTLYRKIIAGKYEQPQETIELLNYISNAHHDGCALDIAEREKKLRQHLNLK